MLLALISSYSFYFLRDVIFARLFTPLQWLVPVRSTTKSVLNCFCENDSIPHLGSPSAWFEVIIISLLGVWETYPGLSHNCGLSKAQDSGVNSSILYSTVHVFWAPSMEQNPIATWWRRSGQILPLLQTNFEAEFVTNYVKAKEHFLKSIPFESLKSLKLLK